MMSVLLGGVLEFELMRQRKEIPEPLRNFFDMWNEDGWDTPGNYGFGRKGNALSHHSGFYPSNIYQINTVSFSI